MRFLGFVVFGLFGVSVFSFVVAFLAVGGELAGAPKVGECVL